MAEHRKRVERQVAGWAASVEDERAADAERRRYERQRAQQIYY